MERSMGSDPPGTRIADRYRVVAALGRGGMGRVYRAVDETTGKRIALKRAMFPKDREAKLAPLFEREYQTLAQLDHPCIIHVYDFGRDERGPFYTMELLEGQDLRELSPLPYRDACRYLRDVASSLALLHARRLVHRDVSPGNVRIGGNDHAKLIDFGALSSFGTNREVIGTPPCIPPEAVHAEPLDERSDLFAFGAVLYYALTGRHAYLARDIASLHSAWLTPPVAPSAIVEGIPEDLDELVLSLLSLDPITRPRSAAVVIDQLAVIAALDTGGEQHLAEAYLRSAHLVGHERELRKLQRRLDALSSREAQLAVLAGPSGIGKTRLLAELALKTRLANIRVVHAAAESHREPYGVARKLALDVIDTAPEIATRAAARHASLLGHVVPELRDRFPEVELEPLPKAGQERVARLLRALSEWIIEVGQAQPLVLLIDNIEHADDSSTAFLASLARSKEAALFIAVTIDPAHARAAAITQQFAREAVVVIPPLLESDVRELMLGLFGDVPNVARFARVMHEASGGNPGLCMQLARHLIRSGHVQYSGGAWVLPQELRRAELPTGIADVLIVRLQKLDPSARELAKQLSISRNGMSLTLVAQLTGQPEPAALRTLDELISAEIVSNDDGTYRFSHDALRERVQKELDADQKQAAQRKLADALHAVDPANQALQLESGLHLMQSGAALEGARRMAIAASQIAEQHAYTGQLLEAIELAADTLERHGAPESECLLLRAQLAIGAFRVDPRIATKHGLSTMARLQSYLGFGIASRLAPFLGKRLALRAGLLIAGVRHALSGRPKRELRVLFQSTIAAWLSLLGVASICMDRDSTERLMKPMRILVGFGARSLPAFAYCLGERMQAQTYGQEQRAEELSMKALEMLRDDQVVSSLTPSLVQSYRGGVLLGLGLTQLFRGDESAMRTAQALNALGFAMYEVVGAQIALISHAYRGETEVARKFHQQVETLALRGGSTWQTEVFILADMIVGYYFTGEVVDLKRATQQLARLSAEIPTLSCFAALAEGIVHVNRNRPTEAIASLEPLLPDFAPHARGGWAMLRAALAGAYTATGQPERAERLCQETLAEYTQGERDFPLMYIHVERELARAESALGKHDAARARSAELIQRISRMNTPLVLGLLHRDAAELAHARGDQPALSEHFERARSAFRVTTNAGLIASVERLAKRFERVANPKNQASALVPTGARTEGFLQSLMARTDYDARARAALEGLVESTAAAAGFLVLFADDAPYVAASVHGDPPDGLLTASSAFRDSDSMSITGTALDDDGSDVSSSSTVIQLTIDNETMALHPFPLHTDQSQARGDLVGVLWLAQRSGRKLSIDRPLLDASASALRVM